METRPALPPRWWNLKFSDSEDLRCAYLGWYTEGGLFVPVPDPSALNLGDTALLMVDLPDGPPRLGLSGKVVWITPKGVSHGGRPSGVGIGFDRGDQATQARDRIERYLGPALSSDRPTWTM